MKKLIYLISSVMIFNLLSLSYSETKGPLQLGLKDAVRRALEQNHSLQVAKLKINEQESVTTQAKSGYLPQVTAVAEQSRQKVNYSSSGFPSSATYNSFQAYIEVTQTVFNRSLSKSIAIAQEQEKSAKSDYSATKEAITLKTVSYYLIAMRAQARINAAIARTEAGRALWVQAKQFEDAGTGSKLESARADLEFQNELQTLSENSTDFETAKLSLAQLINLPQGAKFDLADAPMFEQVEMVSLDSSIQQALNQRPDLISARTQEKTLRLSIEKAQSQWLPTVGITGQLSRTGSDPGNTDNAYLLGAAVSVPLFTGGNIKGQVDQAKVQLNEQRENIKELESEIELDVRSSAIALNAAANQVTAARKGIESAEITLKLTRSRYSEGVSTNLEVVNAQDSLARAQENEIRALYNFNIAKANLSKAIGNIESLYTR